MLTEAAFCLVVCMAYAQEDTTYVVHVPDVMIRGHDYRGIIVSDVPAHTDTTFRFGAGRGDITIPEHVTMEAGSNHAVFDIVPADLTILGGVVSTGITIIMPDGTIREIPLQTHPGAGMVSRLWIVGPGQDGVICDDPGSISAAAIADRAADGVFDTPDPSKEIRTRLLHTAIHVFITDRYCTPVTAPPGGIKFTISTDTPHITFGGDTTHITGVIPQGYNSAIIDVDVNGAGTVYATGNGVSSDSMRIEGVPADATVRLGVGPAHAMESSHVMWYVWLERNGKQYVPDHPIPVYMTTDNPVLAGFDHAMADSSGPAFADIKPHHSMILNGTAQGLIYTGTPARVGDLRLLAGDRDITVTAHVPGYGSATASFHVGMPGGYDAEYRVESDQLRRCMEEDTPAGGGFYSESCSEMWHRILVASHFFDIYDDTGEPLDTESDTVQFLDDLFGGDNTESGAALFRMVDRLNDYMISDEPTGGLADDLSGLLGTYLRTSDIDLQPAKDLGITTEMLERVPDNPPPNRIILEAFPGEPGISYVVISTVYDDGNFEFPVYLPDGTITLAGGRGLTHDPYVTTYGSGARTDAPGTRPSAVAVPVRVVDGGTLSASLGGVGGDTVTINDISPSDGRRLHVATLPGSGARDTIAIVSVLDADGMVTAPADGIHVEAGQGASNVDLTEWRGGGGIIRGTVEGVGEIIIHAPGLGGGTALTTPVRHETSLDVWYPGMVHVSEEFPLAAHTMDINGMPIRMVDVEVSGDVISSGSSLELTAAGTIPIITEHEGLFHAGVIQGFLNAADVRVEAGGSMVQLNDTIVVHVYTGAMKDPRVTVHGGALRFTGHDTIWEAVADVPGEHTVQVSVHESGWEPYTQVMDLRVSHLIEIQYDAVTTTGVRTDADMTICGNVVPGGSVNRMEPMLCDVSVPGDIVVGGVSHALESLTINDVQIQPGAAHNFDGDTIIHATYGGVIQVEVQAEMPDGTMREIMWNRHAPGDTVRVEAAPRYDVWGLVWDRPVQWTGLPAGAVTYDGTVAEWEAETDTNVVVRYERDLTYLIMLGAGALAVPIILLARSRLIHMVKRK